MRLSELITTLEGIRATFGDCQVCDSFDDDSFTLEYQEEDDVLILCDRA